MDINGTILGYDPGGNASHGLALATYRKGELTHFETSTLDTVEDVISQVEQVNELLAIAVDTLSCWSTGVSGWRPADRWLRKNYKEVVHSIASPNSLYGSMGLNGMAVLIALKRRFPNLIVTETHPKVLYFALSGDKYNYNMANEKMDEFLSSKMDCEISTESDHEWDAAISIYAARQGLTGSWARDLHAIPLESSGRMITPCGSTHYWWPD